MSHIATLERLHDEAVAFGDEEAAEFYSEEIDNYWTCREEEDRFDRDA